MRSLTSELESERKNAMNRSKPSEAETVGLAVLERMEKCQNKGWDSGGSIVDRAFAFLDWLENEPVRLMSKFKKLVSPIKDEIKNWQPAKPLLKFVGFGKSK